VSKNLFSSAPLRVDLAGGWTDVAPYPSDFGGEVVNFSINRRVRASREKILGGDGEDFEFSFEAPRGSGLGTSGAMNVALAALTSQEENTPEEIAEMAFVMESDSGNICGRQDQWASAIGGFNHFLFIGNSVEIMPFEPMRSSKMWLRKHLLVVFSGITRKSGEIQKSVWDRYSRGDPLVIDGLSEIRKSARTMANGLQQDRRDMVVNSLRQVCIGVDMIDSKIHDPFRGVVNPLLESGSIVAWKALGAGCGGCAALLCSQQGIEAAISSIELAGWENIDWDFEEKGILFDEKIS